MQTHSLYRACLVLVCLSLALAACSPKPAATTAPMQPTQAEPKAGYPAQGSAQSGYPAQNSAAPAQAYPAPQGSQAAEPANPAYPAPQNGLSLEIDKPDGSTVTLTSADLAKLPAAQNGYKLTDVLAAAGVTSFQQLTVTGTSGSTTLASNQVTADVILATADASGLALAGAQLTADQQVKGITKIQAK